MIAVDTNVLVYGHRKEIRVGEAAHALLTDLAAGDRPWAIPWPCCYEFLSVVTNQRIWKDAVTSAEDAWAQFQAWANAPTCRLLTETDDFRTTLERFVQRPHVVGAVIHDARIAALCFAHGVEELLTRDRDFSLFPELHTRDPFATIRP